MLTKRTIERRDGQSYLVLSIPSDEYGVVDDLQALSDALSTMIGQSARKMPSAEIARMLKSVAKQYDIGIESD